MLKKRNKLKKSKLIVTKNNKYNLYEIKLYQYPGATLQLWDHEIAKHLNIPFEEIKDKFNKYKIKQHETIYVNRHTYFYNKKDAIKFIEELESIATLYKLAR